MINYVTAGESHGPQLTGVLTGIPAGLQLDIDAINTGLAARQGGFGRGNRQQIEHDTVQITGGVRHGVTLGSPNCINDYESRSRALGSNHGSGKSSYGNQYVAASHSSTSGAC